MKIRHIYAHKVGPLGEHWSADLTEKWKGTAYDNVLFTGSNGSGKSFLLKFIAHLWSFAGDWLGMPNTRLRKIPTSIPWLIRWDGGAVIIEELIEGLEPLIGIFFGSFSHLEELKQKHPDVIWFGRTTQYTAASTIPIFKRIIVEDRHQLIFEEWKHAREKLILTPGQTSISNMIYLDAEQRRWVSPTKRIGDLIPDDFRKRWLTTYQVTEDWGGQLEAELINLKIVNEDKYKQVISDLNRFFVRKQIDPTIHEGDRNRLRVNLTDNPGAWHYLDDLSAGERQILITIFIISRWMEPGGIVLIDEPDLHLHPSLVPGLLGQIESMVSERNGQLIITSHMPDVWKRYQTIGKRIKLDTPTLPAHALEEEELHESLDDLDNWLEDQDERMDQ